MNTTFAQSYYNLRRSAKALLIELINNANIGASYVESDFIWGEPRPNNRASIACNTELQISGNPANNRSGVESIWYNRVVLLDLFNGTDVTIMPSATATRLSDVIEEINDKFGIYLTSDDYEDVVLPAVATFDAPRTVALVSKPTSLMFLGSAEIKLGNWRVDVTEVAIANTDVFFVNYHEAELEGTWIQRINTAMAPVLDWNPTTAAYELLPSTINDHVVLSDVAQVFVGDLNYKFTSDIGLTADMTAKAVAILNGKVIDLQTELAGRSELAGMNDLVIYACSRASRPGQVLLIIYSEQSAGGHFTVLARLTDTVAVLGFTPCSIELGSANNLTSGYSDIVPISYLNNTNAADAPGYVKVVISASALILRFLNFDLTNSTTFAPIAIDPVNGIPAEFFKWIMPNHFSFTGRSAGDATKLLLNMKFSESICVATDAVSGYTAPLLRFNGDVVVPAASIVDGVQSDRSWMGCIEITTAGAQVPSKFYSDVLAYRSATLTSDHAAKSHAGLMYALKDNVAYSGIRTGVNLVYCQAEDTVYPVKFTDQGLVELRSMQQLAADQMMTTVLDAVAEEVFYTDSFGVQQSRGLIWHLIGYAANTRNDFHSNKPKALTYMVFDAARSQVLCRQSNLDVLSFGTLGTKGTYMYLGDNSFAWIIRH